MSTLLQPSMAEVWTRCPGSVFWLGRQEGDNLYQMPRDLKYGIVAHIVAANALRGEFNLFLHLRRRRLIPADKKRELAIHAKWYRDKIAELSPKNPLGYGIEATIRLESIIHEKHAKGKVDYFCYDAEQMMIFDYKHGQIPVKVKNNRQLWLYAAGLLETKPWWRGKKVTVAIIQPTLQSVQKQTFTAETVRKLARAYEKKANEALQARSVLPELATYKPLKSVCMWCRGEAKCLATKKQQASN